MAKKIGNLFLSLRKRWSDTELAHPTNIFTQKDAAMLWL